MEPAGLEMGAGILNRLHDAGVINQVRSRLRSDLVQATLGAMQNKAQPPPKKTTTLQGRIADSLVIQHLMAAKYHFTITVLNSESAEPGSQMSPDEIFEAWQLNANSKVRGRLAHQMDDLRDSSQSLLVRLVSEISHLSGHSTAAVHRDTQTETVSDCASAVDRMDARLAKMDEALCTQAEAQVPWQNLEERMIKYQRECEQRAAAETQAEVSRVREVEVSRMRLEEAAKSRAQQEKMREQLEDMHAKRLDEVREREIELRDRFVEKERQLERACYDHRQRILHEMEVLRQRERDAQATERRAATMAATQADQLTQRSSDLKKQEVCWLPCAGCLCWLPVLLPSARFILMQLQTPRSAASHVRVLLFSAVAPPPSSCRSSDQQPSSSQRALC